MYLSSNLAALSLLASVAYASLGAACAVASPASVLDEVGVIGNWAPNCDQPASPRNPHRLYMPANDGSVSVRLDFGSDGFAIFRVTGAVLQPGSELMVASSTSFADMTQAMQNALATEGLRPDATGRATYSLETKGVLVPKEQFLTLSTLNGEIHLVAGGYMINRPPDQPMVKAPALFKCSD